MKMLVVLEFPELAPELEPSRSQVLQARLARVRQLLAPEGGEVRLPTIADLGLRVAVVSYQQLIIAETGCTPREAAQVEARLRVNNGNLDRLSRSRLRLQAARSLRFVRNLAEHREAPPAELLQDLGMTAAEFRGFCEETLDTPAVWPGL